MGFVQDLRVAAPETIIEQEFDSDLQDSIFDLRDTSRGSAKSKERSALFHMNTFLTKNYMYNDSMINYVLSQIPEFHKP